MTALPKGWAAEYLSARTPLLEGAVDMPKDHERIAKKLQRQRNRALTIAARYGQIDGGHHKAWVIDQMCRALLGREYARFVAESKRGEDGPETWDEGIAP